MEPTGNLKKFLNRFPDGEVIVDSKIAPTLTPDMDMIRLDEEDVKRISNVIIKEGIFKHKILMTELFDFSHLVFPNIILYYRSSEGWEEKIECHTNEERKEIICTLFQKMSELTGWKFMFRFRWNILKCHNDTINIEADDCLLDVSQWCDTDLLYRRDIEDDEGVRYVDQAMWRFFYINYFVRAVPTSYTVIDKPVSKTIATGKGKNKKYKNVTKIVHEYTINIKHRTKQELKRCITCPAWGVRGHFRTITNPKTGVVSQVFVRPYVKGKERHNAGAYVAKDYEV